MRNSFFNLDNDRLRSGLCALVLGLCANVTLGQSGFFTGSGSVEAVSGVDANVWRVPYVGYGQFAAPQEDVFAQMRGQWNKEIVQGSNQWFIRASGDAKQQVMHRAANAHRVATEVRLLRHLSGNVRGELGLAISQQKQLEVHWADQEQWESMGSMDIQSFARMHFDVKLSHAVNARSRLESRRVPTEFTGLWPSIVSVAWPLELEHAASGPRSAQV